MKKTYALRAFTLIELLIVVAIIAILAAIAVPNFLEAQTRAKVSRIKSDQRTIATALESYAVDNNVYPEQGPPNSATWPFSRDTVPYGAPTSPFAIAFRLSTPVAYLSSTTSVFADPFFVTFGKASPVNDTKFYNYSGDYYNGRIFDSTQDGSSAAGGDFEIRSQYLRQKNRWHLRSRGPDTDYEKRSEGWEQFLVYGGASSSTPQPAGAPIAYTDGGNSARYDATNGTASNGDIIRFGSDGTKN
jgi:prepilin-type N-terminal cleavage/methylation domain-containing protein